MSRIACATRFFAYGHDLPMSSACALRAATLGLCDRFTTAPPTRVAKVARVAATVALSVAEPLMRDGSVRITVLAPGVPTSVASPACSSRVTPEHGPPVVVTVRWYGSG